MNQSNAPILVVSEFYNKQEKAAGTPLVGAIGNILWSTLNRYGISRADCFVTAVVTDTPDKGQTCSKEQIEAHRTRLREELLASKARVMILVGALALREVTGELRGILKLANYILTPDMCRPILSRTKGQIGVYLTTRKEKYTKGDPKFGWVKELLEPPIPKTVEYIIPVLHPFYIQRKGLKDLPSLRAGCLHAGKAFRGELDLIDSAPESPDLPFGDQISIDIETSSHDNDADITYVGISDGTRTVSLPWDARARAIVRQLFGSSRIIAHNSGFDFPKLGFNQIIPFDTMLASNMLQPDLPKGLETVAPFYLAVVPWKATSGTDMQGYNRMDALTTFRLAQIQQAILKQTGQDIAFESMMKALPVLWACEKRGICIDVIRQQDYLVKILKEMEKVQSEWRYPDISITSPSQVSKLLYGRFRLPSQSSRYGRMTTDITALRDLANSVTVEEHKVALELLIKHRDLAHSAKTWGRVASSNGRVFPRFLPAGKDSGQGIEQGSATGRITSRDPNINGMDHDSRFMIIPTQGYKLAYLDFQQAEARVEAALTHDDLLMDALNSDLHAKISAQLGIDRIRAKNVFYCTGRGGGYKTLAKVLRAQGYKTTETECAEIQAELLKMFPAWAAGRQAWVAECDAKMYVTNPFGVRRYFPRRNIPATIGFIPQSTVAYAMWRILSQLDLKVRLLAPISDALLFEVKEEPETRGVEALMNQEFPEIASGFRFPVDVKVGEIGESWGSLESKATKARAGQTTETARAEG